MRIFLDDKPCDVEAEHVGEAIAEGASLAEEEGRMIVEVCVDGEKWGETQLNSAETMSSAADDIRLTSAEPRALVAQTFADACEALRDADDFQSAAAEHIQSDQHQQAMEKLQSALTIWMDVQQAVVQGTKLAEVDLGSVSVGEKPATTHIDRLNEQLQLVREQLDAGDHLGLADTLLYEFPEIIEEWRDLLRLLQQRVEDC